MKVEEGKNLNVVNDREAINEPATTDVPEIEVTEEQPAQPEIAAASAEQDAAEVEQDEEDVEAEAASTEQREDEQEEQEDEQQ